MKANHAVLFLIGLGAATAAVAADESTRTFVGYAMDEKTNELVYTEIHAETRRADGVVTLVTRYVDPNGNPIVDRTVEFTGNGSAPEFETEDVRSGFLEGMRYDGAEVVAYRRRPGRQAIDERAFGETGMLVVDAGFDRFVLASWDRLMAGESVRASFLVPSRLKRLGFVVEKIDEWRLGGEPVVTFRMSFKNALARLLAGGVKVTYHRDRGILLRYEGLSNIRDIDGENHEVRIDFPLDEWTGWRDLTDRVTRRAANDGQE